MSCPLAQVRRLPSRSCRCCLPRLLVERFEDARFGVEGFDPQGPSLPLSFCLVHRSLFLFSPPLLLLPSLFVPHTLPSPQLWDLKTHKIRVDLPGHTDEVYCVDFVADKIASGGRDKKVKM